MGSAGNKPILQEIEALRGGAILAVLLIHITALPVAASQNGAFTKILYLTINRGLQFAVPLFIMISALVLTYKLADDKEVGWLEFYKKRFWQVAVPFFIWTNLYLALRFFYYHESINQPISQWILWYLFGQGFYHLYFLSVILQFYLLYPLIFKLWAKYRPRFITVMLLSGLLQVAFYWFNRLYIYPHFPYPAYIIFSYLLPIAAGMWLGWNADKWGDFWRRYRLGIVLLAALSGGYFIKLNVDILYQRHVDTFVYQLTWYFYVALISVALFFLAGYFSAGRNERLNKITSILYSIGQVSFGVYLIHPVFLIVWMKVFSAAAPLFVHLYVWLGLPVVLVLSWVSVYTAQKTPFAGMLFGGRKRENASAVDIIRI